MREGTPARKGLIRAVLVLGACALAAGCSKKVSSAPMAVQMREIDKTWALFLATLEEKGPFQAQPYVTQIQGMFRSDVIVNSDLYQNPDFKKKNDDMLDALEKLDFDLGQRVAWQITRSDAQNACRYCHNQFWDKAKKRREGR
jgi:hypothetical protein